MIQQRTRHLRLWQHWREDPVLEWVENSVYLIVNRFSSEPKPAIVWLTPPFQKIRLHVHQTLLSKLSYHPRIRCHIVRCGEVTTVLRATILLKKFTNFGDPPTTTQYSYWGLLFSSPKWTTDFLRAIFVMRRRACNIFRLTNVCKLAMAFYSRKLAVAM